MIKINLSKWILYPGVFAILLFSACSNDDNPVNSQESDHNHAEAVGLVVSLGDQELVRYEEGTVIGQFSVISAQQTEKLSIQFIAKDGDLFTPEGDHYAFKWEIANTAIAEIEQNENYGKWAFHFKGTSAGQTTVIFKIFHEDHADFVSPEIAISVTG